MGIQGLIRGKPRPPRVVLYGPPGVGKSTFGAGAPAPVFLTTEDGVDNLPVDQFPRAKSWTEVLQSARQVAEAGHDFQTLVIDTINGAVDLCSQHVCDTIYGGQWTAKSGNGGFLAWGQGWKATSEEFRKLLAVLDDVRARGMTIALLGHAGLHNVRHPSEGDYQKFAPDIDKAVWSRVSGWADIVLRADYEATVIETKGGRNKVVASQTRVVYSQGSAAEDAKCRVGYELPDQMPLSWEEMAAHLGTKGATLEEIKRLLPILSDDERKKMFAWLRVDTIDDADLTQARMLLNRLRQKAAELAPQEKGESA